MAWYYYTGNIPTPIETGNGDVASVPPYSYVEVVSSNPTVARLMKLGQLRRCGRPKPSKGGLIVFSAPKKDEPKLKDVQPQTKFAKSISEIGKVGAGGKVIETKSEKTAKAEKAKGVKEEPKPKTKRSRRTKPEGDDKAIG